MEYNRPEIEIIEILAEDVMLVSGGTGDGGSTPFSLERNLLQIDQ